eukprot:7892642-Pyramimonas_sp.AAC.1
MARCEGIRSAGSSRYTTASAAVVQPAPEAGARWRSAHTYVTLPLIPTRTVADGPFVSKARLANTNT